ncbi:MAG: glutathione S-transferase [Hahellaceae bacterium]|nr:glutathione S-transferase [Hahellaceae bacterium]
MKLVASPTSPFARKVHVMLLEKNLPFEWHESIPWNADSDVPRYNPLGKVPALVAEDGKIWTDSPVIAEYLETLSVAPRLVPVDPLGAVEVRQIEALADGVCEAAIQIFLEKKREVELQSAAWIARQEGKLEAGLAALAEAVKENEWVYGESFSLADIAIVCFLEWFSFRFTAHTWKVTYPALAAYVARVAMRGSFQKTQPR